MLLGFKTQFAGYVEEGSKTHTIRARRKTRPKIGEICHCYTGLRTKQARLLGRWRCVKVERIMIYERGDKTFGVEIEGVELSTDEKNALAWRDGFRTELRAGAFAVMMRFWMKTHGNAEGPESFVFEGDLIHWNYAERCDAPRAAPSPMEWGRQFELLGEDLEEDEYT